MRNDIGRALRAAIQNALPYPADVTVMQREAGDVCVLVDWRADHFTAPPLRICILEDVVSSYTEGSPPQRNQANIRLATYIRDQFAVHDAFKHAVANGQQEYVEWTIMRQQIYDDQIAPNQETQPR